MTKEDKKYIVDFMRRIANEIESNEKFDFSFSVLPKKPSTISIDLEVTHPEFNDFDINMSLKDFPIEIVVSSDPVVGNNDSSTDKMKRYEFYNSYGDAFMIESTDGEYVKYDDHIALFNKSSEDTQA